MVMEVVRELVRGLRDGDLVMVDSIEEREGIGAETVGEGGELIAAREMCVYGDAVKSLTEVDTSLIFQKRSSGEAEGGEGCIADGDQEGDQVQGKSNEEDDTQSVLAELRLELGAHDFARGRLHESIDHFEQARALAGRAGADALSTRAEYFLAQSYQRLGDAARAARSCAGTLKAQLRARTDETTAGSFDVYSWVNNCLQLAGYFLNDEDDFATAKYCTQVADAVCAADVGDKDNDDARASRANVKLSWAKLCLNALRRCRPAQARSHSGGGYKMNGAGGGEEHVNIGSNIHKEEDEEEERRGGEREPAVSFHDEMPSLAHEPEAENGDGAVPSHIAIGDVHLARRAFNTGMTCFNAALEYYMLDSWASECCEIVIDRNGLFIGLSKFEPDASRRRALHKARARLVLPLLREMNSEKFSNLFRSLHFDAAEALVAVMDTYEHDVDENDGTRNAAPHGSSSEAIASDATGDGGAHVSAKTRDKKATKLRKRIIDVGRSAAAHYEAILTASTSPSSPSSSPSLAAAAAAAAAAATAATSTSTEASTHMDASDMDFLRKVHFSSARVHSKLSSLIAAESDVHDASARADAASAVSSFDTYVTLSRDAQQFADEVDVATNLAGLLRLKFNL